MFRAFSGSCLSLEDMDTVRAVHLVERPHVLGPGVDFFTEDGEPVRPQLGGDTLQKVFSGSALDLNAMNGTDVFSDEETFNNNNDNSPCPSPAHSRLGPSSVNAGSTSVTTILNQLSTETEKERIKNAKSKVVVLVIGDYEYLSSHVVIKLLEAGYTVRLTVPLALQNNPPIDLYPMSRDTAQRLNVLEADMTNSSSLRDAIKGCKYIIHCGCPQQSDKSKNKNKSNTLYHTQAIQALFDGIRLSGKATVKRVILTGASSSVFHVNDPTPECGLFDETHWNTIATEENDPVPYAKIIFEKEAWRLKHMLGVELVVLLPSIMIGPSYTCEMSSATLYIQNLAENYNFFPFAPKLYWNYVDVRDVAEAHVRALECAEIRDQRVILSNASLSVAEVSQIIKKLFPHLTPPTMTLYSLFTLLLGITQYSQGVSVRFLWRNLGMQKKLDNQKAINLLYIQFTPIEETIRAVVEQMIRMKEFPTSTAINDNNNINTNKNSNPNNNNNNHNINNNNHNNFNSWGYKLSLIATTGALLGGITALVLSKRKKQ